VNQNPKQVWDRVNGGWKQPAPKAPGTAMPAPQAAPAAPSLNYQTGFNADRQAVNTGNVLDRLGKEGKVGPLQGSHTGQQAARDLQKSQQFNDAAQIKRGLEQKNSEQQLQNQVTRSELMQAGLSNQSKIYSDMTQRSIDQVGLAAKLQEAMIRNRFALQQALLQ
jgi:hypothetical protein